MHAVDYWIIVIYLSLLIVIGLFFRRRAGLDAKEYFLGGRRIPWWLLGISGMASNFDMTGTMLITSLFYVIGVKGFWVEIRGGVVLVLAFMMVFIGKWHSRSGVMTAAEWMEFRFGRGKQGEAARLLSAFAILAGTIGAIGYSFVGMGKFLSIFLPFPPFVCAMIMISITLLYTTMGGLLGVVYTGLVQAALIVFSIIFISVKAFTTIDPQSLRAIAPAGWGDIIPPWRMNLPSGYDMYNLFGISVIFFFLKTVIEGMGAPGGYMAQRYFASRNDRDSGYLSVLWIFLLSFRWPFIVGAAVLGLSLGAGVAEPETALPLVIVRLIPAGLKGLLISALIAAEMSTFDATVNAAASYLVNDIYFKYVNPRASGRQLVRAGYFSSVLIVVLGVMAGSLSPSINAIWGWLTMSLVAGMIMPNFLRWYWWRFNGWGFAVGTGTGILAALAQKIVFPGLHEWQAFLAVVSASLIGMVAATFLTSPTDESVLVRFFMKTRPIGFWRRITRTLDAGQARLISIENRRDMTAVLFAVPWQISLFLAPVFLVLHDWKSFAAFLAVNCVTAAGLYFTWFRRLSRNDGTKGDGPDDSPFLSFNSPDRRKNDL